MITEDPRFAGIGRLYGTDALARLAASHVVVVGIGGVGSWVAEALARTGIGRISLIDLDEVCVSNVNRQLHALDGQVGRPKVEVMAERLRAISPECDVRPVMDFVTPSNLAELITDDIDCVVDCIDSVNAKVALIAWCRRRKIPVITTGGAGGQIDPTQITVADLSKTVNDPLAAKARSLLRRDHNFPVPTASAASACPASTRKSNCATPNPTAASAPRNPSSVRACAWTAPAASAPSPWLPLPSAW